MRQLRPHAPIIMLPGTADVLERALKSGDVFILRSLWAGRVSPAIAQWQVYRFDRRIRGQGDRTDVLHQVRG
jgi:hypothetical protein